MEEPTYTAIDYNSLENRVIEGLVGDYYQMVKNTFETVLRCSEGNRVWYRLWINPEDMMRIEPLLEIGFGWKNLRCIILSSMR